MSLMIRPVSSSMLSRLIYDDKSKTLFADFTKSGATYRYDNVIMDEWVQLEAAMANEEKSVSAEFNAIIRDHKAYSKLEGKELEAFQEMIAEPAPPIPMGRRA